MNNIRIVIFTLLLTWLGADAFGQITGTVDPGYCTSTNNAGSAGGLIAIRDVLFNEIQGPTNLTYTQGYRNMNATWGTATVFPGQMMHLSIQDGNGGSYTRGVQAWLDMNGDGIFSDPGERIIQQPWYSGNGNVISGYFYVPTTATVGPSQLRVDVRYNAYGTACGYTGSNGQVFDYDVVIAPAISPIQPVVFDGGDIVEDEAGLVQINNVSIGSINQNSLAFGTQIAQYNYSNYTWVAPTDITSGVPQTLSISQSGYTSTLAAWIDYNNDGDFTDPGEEIGKIYDASGFGTTFNFTPPAGIPHNTQTMMRVRVVYDDVTGVITPTNTVFGNFDSNTNNETEDYRVTLINSGCSVIAGTAALTNNVACTSNADLTISGQDAGTTIQWFESTDNVTFTPISGATGTTYTTGTLSSGTTYYYYAEVTDGCTNPTNKVSVNGTSSYIHSTADNSVTMCNGTYTDPGGASSYPTNTDSYTTFYPCNPGDKVSIDFTSFDIEYDGICQYDQLYVLDGNNLSAPILVGPACGTTSLGSYTSTAVDGSLTVYFVSDGFVNGPGWTANISCISPPTLVCAPVSNLAAAIGDPANGLAHHMDVTWDALTGATGYDIEYSNNGSSWTSLGSTTTNSYDHNFGDNPNVAMYYRVRAKDASTTCAFATMVTPVYTACDLPAVPTTSNVTQTTLDLDIVAETPVANPAITTYSIYEQNTGLYVQANGSLGATEVFQTKAQWGTVTVTGLTATTEYCFVLTARNFDGDERGGAGASLQALQTFDNSSVLFTSGNPTNQWYSPSSCTTGGQVWNGSNGCPGGAVGFSGSFNGFYGCYLRSPAINCGTLNTVVMTFDISNSYFATQPNDRVYFNMWAPTSGSPGGTYISASKVNGVTGSNLYFTAARTCEQVVVEFDLTNVTNKSAILFYLNADCAYNNSNVFSYWSDNISITEPAPTACATTSGLAPDLVVQSITPLSGSVCGATPVDYEVVIENQGTADIAPGTNFDVAAYVGSLACAGTAVSSQTITTGLAASATTTLTFSLSLSGSGDVSFEVDATAAITETNESNNCASDNTVTVGSGLGGTYTIDASLATGGTNYASFSDAAADLNAFGVCAPVIFDVATDTYNENITLTDVAGVSAVNTVTFRSASGVASQVTLQSSTTDVVVLHNADYFRFQNMTIQYTGTSSYSAIELQDDADNTIISSCILGGGTGTSNTSAIIYVSESTTSLLIDELSILDNIFSGGAYGIYFLSGSAESTGIEVNSNSFSNNIFGAISLDDCIAPIVTNNYVTSSSNASTSYTGIEIENGSVGTVITNNIISSEYAKYGVFMRYTDASAVSPTLIANNFIAIGGTYGQAQGIALIGSDYVDVYFNSVHMYTSSNTSLTTCLYNTSSSADGSINIQNNIFAQTGGGGSQTCMYFGSSTYVADVDAWDYNDYYTTGSSYLAYIGGARTTLADLQSYTSKDANSLDVDPLFASSSDLHVSESDLIAGTSIAAITDDIDGDTRQPTPTIGADEFFVALVANDAGVTNMLTPSVPPCPGNSAFEVEVTNYGTSTLTSVTVEWSVNGVPQTPVNATGLSVATGNSTTVSLGSFNLVSNTAYEFIFNTTLPNGNADGNLLNDTLTLSNQYTSLIGTYTIGGATPDFASFNGAVDALHAYGVCGPVIFNVRQGTYTEQVEINAIGGVSAVNTVTFQADPANSSAAILQYNSQGFSDNFVLGIYGSSYLRFHNLTINTTASSSYRRVIAFTQANNDIQFTNNIIGAPVASSNSNSQALVFGEGTVAYTDDNILFSDNILQNGSFAILMDGSSSAYENDLVITNNFINGFYSSGIQLNYQTNVTINNNVIRNGVGTANATGIDLFYVDGDLSIQKNIIECSGSSNPKAGISTGPTNLTSGNRGVIANNFISVEGTSTCTGIDLGSTTSYVDVIYNNVYTNGTNATSTRGLYTNGASNIRLYNNNFVAGGAGYAMYLLGSPLAASDYNNFYTTNTEFIYQSGNQPDLATWQGNGNDANSVTMDPSYTSTTSPMDLHISETALAGAGVTFGGITTDIDGDVRTAPPTIGADEITAGCGTNTWTGTISNDWHVDGNWGCGVVPTKTTVVSIPAAPVNQPIVYTGATAECLSIEMQTGSELTIQEGAIMDVAKP